MKKNQNPVRLIIIFVVVVIILAAISLGYKVFTAAKNSEFKGNTLNLIAIDSDVHILHLNKSEKKQVIVTIDNAREEFVDNSKLAISAKLQIPIDAVIITRDNEEFGDNIIDLSTVFTSVFAPRKSKMINLNEFDIVKIYSILSSISAENKIVKDVKYSEVEEAVDLDFIDYDLLRDREIFNEKRSIEIVNSTGIDGLGTKISNMLRHVGFNVVAVETGNSEESALFYRKDEYAKGATFLKLNRVFDFDKVEQNPDIIADVSIVLGRNLKKIFE